MTPLNHESTRATTSRLATPKRPLGPLLSQQGNYAVVAVTMAVLAHFVNNPHFAHSYQIFYSGFGTKAFSWTTPPALRVRYILAGIIVPLALVTFFTATILRGHLAMLGLGINLMGFLVGWYVGFLLGLEVGFMMGFSVEFSLGSVGSSIGGALHAYPFHTGPSSQSGKPLCYQYAH